MKARRRALAQRRKIVGHTQESLAEFLGVERSTVVRWEAGETCPLPWCRGRLAEALRISLEDLNRLLAEGQPANGADDVVFSGVVEELSAEPEHDRVLSAPWSHRGTVEAAVVLKGGDRSVKRRHFAFLTGAMLTAPAHQWLVHEPGRLVSGLTGRRVSIELADRFTAMIAELRAMDDVAGGGTVLSLAEQQFGLVADLLDQASYDEPTGRQLHRVLAELGRIAGWSAYDAGQSGLAQRYNVAALRAAHSADDRLQGAHILSFMAYQATRQGRPAEAATLIDTAVAGVRGQETPALLAELYIKQADALATLRDAPGCAAAIAKARTQIEQLKPENEPQWLYWVSPAEITAYSGQCLLQLGHVDQAIALLNDGIALFDGSFPRNLQAYLTHLANALTRPGKQRDLDAAASRGMEAIHLAESLDSTHSVDLLRDLCRQMQPHAEVPAVGDFLDQARELVRV